MAIPQNILQNVITYQKAELAWMLNSFVAIHKSNKKFENFNSRTANLGDTVSFDLAPRFINYNGLVTTNQPSQQRTQTLACSQATNISSGYSDQQFIFNVEEYLDRFGESAAKTIGTAVESDILANITSSVAINNPQDPNFGQLNYNSGPYRFYGDGRTAINSFGQLAQIVANFNDYGAAMAMPMAILPLADIPAIVNSGLNQFALNRNNELAIEWQLGRFSQTDWYTSNLLPIHIAGNVGQNKTTGDNILTVVSTNDPTGANITQITFSGATDNDDDAIFYSDMFEFIDGVANQPNLRFLTFIGNRVSQQPVQFRSTAQAGATNGGQVTVNIYPPLCAVAGQNQNINNNIAAGMKVQVMDSHRAGVLHSGNQFYLAMPQLPDVSPFESVRTMDPDSGCSIRHYWGSQLGQNVRQYTRDCIWGSTLVPENSMRILFPL